MHPTSTLGEQSWLIGALLMMMLPACFAARPADTKVEADGISADSAASMDVGAGSDADGATADVDGDSAVDGAAGPDGLTDAAVDGQDAAPADAPTDLQAGPDGADGVEVELGDAPVDVSPVSDVGSDVQAEVAQPGPDGGQDAPDDGTDAQACVPASEQCNGKDDDCDGLTDEAGAEESCVVVAACAKAVCVAGACLDVPSATASGACSDNNACTTADVCTGGSCTGTPKVCKDGEPCTDDGCDVVKGCVFSATSAPCSDGDACTVGDGCQAGNCAGGKPLACGDGNPCTADACDKASGCTFLPASGTCTDGDACTSGDLCTAGACTGTPKVCKDGEPCTDDGCDVAKGCVFSPTVASCSDGNVCTVGDICQAGSCAGGQGLACSDGNPCTLDGCDKASGCTFLPGAGTCTDGDACTSGDACQNGLCLPGKTAKCDDGNACTKDACDKGNCTAPAVTGPCDDGDPCTLPGTCIQAKCALVPKDCNDQDPCTTDSCDKVSGSCKHAAVAGCGKAACGGQSDCKVGKCDVVTHACLGCLVHGDCASGQVCKGGACVLGVQCASTSQCKATAQVCDAVGGLCVDCLGESDCGAGKTCLAKACVQKTTCASDTACPAVCAKALGVCAECNVAADCAGKGWCAADHTCHAPVCTAGACQGGVHYACKADGSAFVAVACDDQNPCTTDTCDPAKGCSHPLASQGAACPGGLCDGKGGCKGVVTVATSYATTCAIDKAGALWCWGNNKYGQLGDGTTLDRNVPVQVKGMPAKAIEVAVGQEHTCAIVEGGAVYCWGANYWGQLGTGQVQQTPTVTPQKVGIIPQTAHIATADYTTCAVGTDGSAWCWGRTDMGETGVGKKGMDIKQPAPEKLTSLDGAAEIAAGYQHFCAVLVGGSVACWGNNYGGQTGNGQAGYPSALATPFPAAVLGLDGVATVTAVQHTTCAAKKDGSAWCWGANGYGELGVGKTAKDLTHSAVALLVPGLDQVVELAGGQDHHVCALRQDGGVWCWGEASEGQLGFTPPEPQVTKPTQIPMLSSTASLAGTCAVATDGKLRCWGANRYGQVGDGTTGGTRTTPTSPVAVAGIGGLAAGSSHACARTLTGKVHCWGAGWQGQLGSGSQNNMPAPVEVQGLAAPASDLAAGYMTTCALVQPGVWCWGGNQNGLLGVGKTYQEQEFSAKPVQSSVATGAAALAMKHSHACAIVPGSQVKCWGENSNGQATTTNVTGVLQVGVGSNSTCVRRADGKVACWGQGSVFGGTSSTPKVLDVGGATDLGVGSQHACVIDTKQQLFCWGSNQSGQLGVTWQSQSQELSQPTLVGNLPAMFRVFPGQDHTCAIAADGAPWCWGNNNVGQLGDGTKSQTTGEAWKPRKVANWTGKAIAMALAEHLTCALRDDGKAFCWGSNDTGQLGDGSAWKTAPTLVKGLP